MSAFLNRARLNRVAVAIVISLCLAIFLSLNAGSGEFGLMLWQGDYPGFYSPAEILRRGLGDRLYDQELHKQIQNHIWPERGAFYISVYPPYVAWILQPLAWVSPMAGKAILTVAMLLCHVAAVLVLLRDRPSLKKYRFIIIVCSLLWIPSLTGILSAQNSALSFLLVALLSDSLRQQTPRGDFHAGMYLGLWLFKPQFAVVGLVLLFFQGRWNVLKGFMLPFLLYYGVGVMVRGWNWPFEWYTAAHDFGGKNYEINSFQMVSLVGGIHAMVKWIGLSGSNFVSPVAYIVSSGFLVTAVVFVKRLKRDSFSLVFPLLVALVAPQTLFYDLGFCIAVFLYFFRPATGIATFLCFSWVAFFMRDYTGLPLFFFLAIAMYIYVVTNIALPARESEGLVPN